MSVARDVSMGVFAGFMGYVVIVGAISVFNGASVAISGKSLQGYIAEWVPSINPFGA